MASKRRRTRREQGTAGGPSPAWMGSAVLLALVADALVFVLHGGQLAGWISDVEATDAPTLRSFAHGLRNDLDAVTNGLTLGYSSGAVEGTVNRIKTIKRQMYGRAKFDLLRTRILNPA